MSLVVNNNFTALTTANTLNATYGKLEKSTQRLSSAVAACSASSFMRMSFSSMVSMAPSAVWISEMASLALRTPWFSAVMSERINSRMARPRTSSGALCGIVQDVVGL